MAGSEISDVLTLGTIFFVVKRRLKKLARDCVPGIAESEAALNDCWTMKNWRSWRRKGGVVGVGAATAVLCWSEEKE